LSKQEFLHFYNIASLLKNYNCLTEARDTFKRLLEIIGKKNVVLRGKILFHLGEISLRLKNKKMAFKYLKESVKAYPKHIKAQEYLKDLLCCQPGSSY
ncbi:MAG: hypothetical protein AB1765_11850, partial [Candidatus Hydrogenedentota bacterium]